MITIDRSVLERELERLANILERDPLTEVLQEARAYVEAGIIENFRSSSSPDGQPWPARKHIGDGHPLLIDTQALIGAAGGNAGGHIARVQDRTLDVGVDGGVVPYAGVHNRGGRRMPRREYMGLSEEAEDQIEELIADRVLERLLST